MSGGRKRMSGGRKGMSGEGRERKGDRRIRRERGRRGIGRRKRGKKREKKRRGIWGRKGEIQYVEEKSKMAAKKKNRNSFLRASAMDWLSTHRGPFLLIGHYL